jgi:hypothetical protein
VSKRQQPVTCVRAYESGTTDNEDSHESRRRLLSATSR